MGVVLGRKPEHETLCFSVWSGCSRRWLKGTSCVRRLQLSRLRSFGTRLLSPLCSATSGCVCVRSSMRFLQIALNGCMIVVIWCCHACSVERCRFATGWCEAHCNGCMNVAWGLCWGGTTFTQPLQCVSQHPVANPHLSTRMATPDDNNHAAIPMRSATTTSGNAKNYAHNYAHRHNHSLQNTEEEPIASGTTAATTTPHIGTFHRQLRPLYTEKHKISCSGFLPNTTPMQHSCSHYNALRTIP